MSVSPSGTTMIMRRAQFLTFFLLVLAFVFHATPILAQEQTPTYSSKKKEAQGPRAIGVLEWTSKGPRLLPITIKINNQFYDAGLYMAQPIPMAIDTGVIYEVQKAGEPLGDFTLELAQQTPSGTWVGIGSFDSKAVQDKRKEDAAKATEAAAKAAAAEASSDERPVLKRPGAKPSTPAPDKASTPDKPAPEATKPAPAPDQKTASTPSAAPSAPLQETESDVNRPVLKRGKPKEEQARSLGNEQLPTKKPVPPPPGLSTLQVAVSDAAPGEPHPYKWTWASPEEERKIRSQAEKLALQTLTDYAAKTGGPKPGKLQDVTFQVYDLSYSNAADVILSARVLPDTSKPVAKKGAKPPLTTVEPSTGFEYYVTIIGRENIYAELQKTLAVATDNKHLDAFPKMQLVDVVDVDGNGVGELLFRSTNDRSTSFVIYRDLGYRLDEVIRVPEPKE